MNGDYMIFNDLSKIHNRSTNILKLSLVCMFGCASLCIFMVYRTNESVKNRFYLLDKGHKVAAVRVTDPKRALNILCKGHIRSFHELFFSLEPDLQFIKNNIEGKALYMIDRSGERLYNRLVDQNYYEDVAKSEYSIEMEMDSIQIEYARYPYRFRFTGKQRIIKNGDTEYRNLVTTGHIEETTATDNNLNGLKIGHFKVIDNSDL